VQLLQLALLRQFKLMRVNLHFYKLQALQRLLLLYRAVLMAQHTQPLALL
jgi:hypothetical protein